MKLLNFSIIKLTACLIAGIIIGFYFNFSVWQIAIGLCISFSSLAFSFLYHRKRYTSSPVFGGFALVSFIFIGIFSTLITNETLRNSHYLNSEIDLKNHQNIQFKVKKRLKPNTYNAKYIVEITRLNSEKTSGQLLLNLQKDTTVTDLNIGSIYYTKNRFVTVQKPRNPFQFDYKTYLKQRQIYHQIYVKPSELLPESLTSNSLMAYADVFRKTVNSKLKNAGFKPEALGIINALLLGQRQDIDQDIYNNYVNAGTIHILAVSGLHVGIVFLILSFLFKPIELLKYGKHYLKPALIVLVLWAFAFIAGLSPSVTRAVTMFSIIAIAQHLKRPTNIYNTITISAFVILICKPIFLFDVGFQMSYLAVFAIVSIQPLLYKLWQPKYYIVDKPWQIFTVTLAAQLGVAPISLFYFHQFPGLFFVSNLVIIPFLALILGFGLLIITLALLNILPHFLVMAFSFVIDCLNGFIAWVAQFEDFLFRDIPFTLFHVFSAYLILISLVQLWKHKTTHFLIHTLLSFVLFSSVIIYTKFETSGNAFIVFNKNRATVIAQKKGKNLSVHYNSDSLDITKDNMIKNYKVGHFINTITTDSLRSIYSYNNQLVLVIDSLGAYKITGFKPDYVLLRNSPKLNLNRLIDLLQPKHIIADASNYKSYVELWKETCKNKKIPFHSTYEKGAFVIE